MNYLAFDQAGSASSRTFESVERWKREFFETLSDYSCGVSRADHDLLLALDIASTFRVVSDDDVSTELDYRASAVQGFFPQDVPDRTGVSGTELAFRKAVFQVHP